MKTSGLSFKEAVTFGRPLKHKSWDNYYTYNQGKFKSLDGTSTKVHLLPEEALSSEWEVKTKDSYTREDLERVVKALASYIPVGVASQQQAMEAAFLIAEKEQ